MRTAPQGSGNGVRSGNDMEESESGSAAAPSGAQVQRDIAYGPAPRNVLDVYRPANVQNAPILFMVHGGAWRMGDKALPSTVTNKAGHWVPKGYVFVSVNYTFDPIDPLHQADEVAKALAFVQAHAADWGADATRIVLMGHSAGAHLVSLLASDPSIASQAGAKPWLGTIALDSAAFDVERIMRRWHFPLYDRAFGEDPTYWRKASPLQRLNAAPKPILIVCSSRRGDSCQQAQAFVDKVSKLGGSGRVMPLDKTHREINVELGEPGPYTDAVASFLQSLGLP